MSLDNKKTAKKQDQHKYHMPTQIVRRLSIMQPMNFYITTVWWTGPTSSNGKPGPVQQSILCTKHGSLQFCLWFYQTVKLKTKLMFIKAQSDLGHDDLYILRKYAVFCLVTDCLGGQLLSSIQHFSFGFRRHHAWGLNLDHFIPLT